MEKRRVVQLISAILLALTLACGVIPVSRPIPDKLSPSISATDTLHIASTPVFGSPWLRPVDGMLMVYVPAGDFSMGSNNGDTDEEPIHAVYLDTYWIDQTEVTNGMYAGCVTEGACQPPFDTTSYTRDAYFGNSQYADYPVIYVSENDAQTYCNWVGGRLPIEAEWEKAARGMDGRTFPWGNVSPTCALANYWVNGEGCVGDTAEVGIYPTGASPYGALDMAGNVWEWVNEWYDVYPGGNPRASNDFGQTHLVRRGGAFNEQSKYIRTTERESSFPDTLGLFIGFRCAYSLP